MTWRDTLLALQEELAEVRAERLRQAREEEADRQTQRQQLSEMAASLGIAQLVQEMNEVLLKDAGTIESYNSWESSPDDPRDAELIDLDLENEDEDAEYISAELIWEEDGEREIAVDLGISDEGLYLQVNGIDVRLEREALEQALLEAFREELQL
ncbi:MAG TPA: hypothetical protein VFA32_04820 [Dehalococcoidia bacterium]|jgi:hypothetical protein|nr:hypothetical protein [Dehalococcoidia bacterium]